MKPLHDKLIIIDTETGGLDPLTHSILSIGMVAYDGSRQTEIFVREPCIISHPRSMQVNGIDLEWIERNGLSPAAAVDAVENYLNSFNKQRPLMLCGHNIQFDLAFMRRLYVMADRRPPREFTHRSIDTQTLLWALADAGKLPRKTCTSNGAFDYFNIQPPVELRHTALGDAVATRKLVQHLLEMIG